MRYHELVIPLAADPALNLLDPAGHRPRADIEVPEGCLAVQVMNAHPTSAAPDGHQPGDIAVLPRDEAAVLLRAGYAREVLTG